MARKVLYFAKRKELAIQGVCGAGTTGVSVGFVCDGSARHGGGVVSDMEVAGQCILIRKSGPDGQPHRDCGAVAPRGQPNQVLRLCPADGVLWPLVLTEAVVFVDEPDAKAQPAAQPKQEQPKR